MYPLLPDFIPVLGELDDIFVVVWQVCNIISNDFESTPAYIHASANNNKLGMVRQGTEMAAEVAAAVHSKEEALPEVE